MRSLWIFRGTCHRLVEGQSEAPNRGYPRGTNHRDCGPALQVDAVADVAANISDHEVIHQSLHGARFLIVIMFAALSGCCEL